MKIKSIEQAIEIVMEALSIGMVGAEKAEEGADLHTQLTFIVGQVRKEMFWKRLRLWAYGPLIFSDEVFSIKKRRFKKVSKACRYLLKNKKLRKYLDDRAFMYLFNSTDPFNYDKSGWLAKPYSANDKDKLNLEKKFKGSFVRSGEVLDKDETYSVVKVVVDGKNGEKIETYSVKRRKKLPIEERLGLSPCSATVVLKEGENITSPEVISRIVNQVIVKMNPRLLEFFETRGRRLAELKVQGGQEYMIIGTTNNLTADELKEFKALSLQMDAMIWVLMPDDANEQKEFVEEVKEVFGAIEKPYFDVRDMTKGKKLPRGYA
jgi:hypothetical protein